MLSKFPIAKYFSQYIETSEYLTTKT